MKETTNERTVEAVARTLCEQAGYDPDSLRPGDDPYMNNTPVNDGVNAKGDTCHFRWRAYYWQAQAALAAARAAQCEYICKCGLRVEPHRCRDTKGEF